MKISEERLNHLTHLIVDGVWNDDLVDYSDEDQAMRLATQATRKYLDKLKDIDGFARNKVASLKRNVIEGTPEWEVLYGKYYEEELIRRGQV